MYKNFIVLEESRLDKFLSEKLGESRNQIEQLIKKEYVKVDDKIIAKTGYKLKENQEILVELPEVEESISFDVDFDVEIIYEDEHILVINKPYNLVVHPAASVKEPTLVDWLKTKDISLSTISGEERHGIVHRLDKGTSGVMVVAKTNEAHVALSKQLEDKTMGRYYLAIIDLPLKDNIIIDKPIARNPNNRLKMGIVEKGKNAKTAFAKIALSEDEKYELICCKLFTGRTHQIRVHLNSINRHILGDNLYGFKGELNKINRFYLHAFNLYLIHPITNEKMDFKANITNDINKFLNENFNMETINDKMDKNFINSAFNFID
ncbi:pseudouridine synthase, RluA family [Arcobacter nitrofigilis DSM 7299]|uniref:Pseudouridine synthase n=1 Tax=Arcobacter nitrofigilis (strain ATCC 33309 / DSM 7299 / CCUG 15893 / LMG 7604 / NCTC 12251 / CI) TaxID=572480 RepID=D5V5C7_ARCNC|nr:RluA family pseudouridine synthase [Arcobacter nitrofigilis]ADG93062.1 pseudouridine synthase, RluA family [Arcobacter nitrofigilis DSM 7299]